MNKKSGYALRIVLGGYLTYLGIRILSEMIQQRPSNMTLMSVLAVVFILVGVAYAGNAICKTFEIDIKKQIAKMIAKRKAEQKRKAEEAAAAKEMSTASVEKSVSVEKTVTTTESEETPDEEIKAEGTPVEETPAQEEELTDTRVVDIFAELNEEPVSEDAENDFEEK